MSSVAADGAARTIESGTPTLRRRARRGRRSQDQRSPASWARKGCGTAGPAIGWLRRGASSRRPAGEAHASIERRGDRKPPALTVVAVGLGQVLPEKHWRVLVMIGGALAVGFARGQASLTGGAQSLSSGSRRAERDPIGDDRTADPADSPAVLDSTASLEFGELRVSRHVQRETCPRLGAGTCAPLSDQRARTTTSRASWSGSLFNCDRDQATVSSSTWATLTERAVDSHPACGPQ
jgi:hypothetical protein